MDQHHCRNVSACCGFPDWWANKDRSKVSLINLYSLSVTNVAKRSFFLLKKRVCKNRIKDLKRETSGLKKTVRKVEQNRNSSSHDSVFCEEMQFGEGKTRTPCTMIRGRIRNSVVLNSRIQLSSSMKLFPSSPASF